MKAKSIASLFIALLLTQTVFAEALFSEDDVRRIFAQALSRAREVSPNSVVAVTDREGNVLGVCALKGRAAPMEGEVALAVAKAGTAAFLSSDQHAFTSRTAGFIVQQHFPPGVQNKPPGPLVGVNFSNLPFSDVNRFKGPNGEPMPGTSLNGLPGGVPLFKGGHLIGGVGVTGDGVEALQVVQEGDTDEDVALAGQVGFAPEEMLLGSHVFIDGIRVPYVNSSTSFRTVAAFDEMAQSATNFPVRAAPPPFPYPEVGLAGVNGQIRTRVLSDPASANFIDDPDPGLIRGQPRLTKEEVTSILSLAARRAATTRAGIRLPRGQPAQVFITVVNNPDVPDAEPKVLGTFRTADATIFSWDVAVQKARTAIFFSSDQRAFSTRTVGFLAQSLYPPGIENTAPGIFYGLQERFSMFAGTNTVNGVIVMDALQLNPSLPNGVTIFPGGFPLYRNGVLVGAIGISGDGVDQDDIIGASGTRDFLAPVNIRADRFTYRGARLPYAKFPRNPSL